MKYKLLASDLDGTLLNEVRTVSRKNIKTIQKLHNTEVHFTIATGRNHTNVTKIAKSVGISIPVITNDGALIIDLATKKPVYEKRFDLDTAKEVIEVFNKYDIGYSAHLFEGTFLNKKFKIPARFLKSILKPNLALISRIFHMIKEKEEFLILNPDLILKKIEENNDLPYKFSVFPNDEKIVRQVEAELNDKFGDVLNVVVSHESSMEIGLKGVSKATGLMILEEHLNVSTEEVMVFGDNYNDVEMMKYAGFGVVMENAPEDLKKLADFVTDTNERHGVGKAIEKFVLSPLASKN